MSNQDPLQPNLDPNADRLAAYNANQAYRAGKWLAWYAQDLGREPNDTEKALMGGEFADAALTDNGYDGTVISGGQDPLRSPYGDSLSEFTSLHRFLNGTRTEEEALYVERTNALRDRHEFHTSPVVREPARLLSNEPITEFDRNDPRSFVWSPTDAIKALTAKGGASIEEQSLYQEREEELPYGGKLTLSTYRGADIWDAELAIDIPEGHRLIIDGIPKGGKYDRYPYSDENPLTLMQVQIYHNSEGYLVADKVFGDRIAKKREVTLKATDDANTVSIDEDAPTPRAMHSLWASNDRKLEFIDPIDPTRKSVRFLATTPTKVVGKGTYTMSEIEISTPDDAGSRVDIMIEDMRLFNQGQEVRTSIYMVPDTSRNLAPEMYQ